MKPPAPVPAPVPPGPPHIGPTPLPDSEYTHYIRIRQTPVEFDFGDIIIPLTKSDSDQHGRNVCQALAGIPLENDLNVNLSNVFWFIVNRAPYPGTELTKAEMKLVNALLPLSKINYIRNMFVGAGGRLVPSQKADTIAFDLSTKTWNHKMLRDRSGVEFDAPRRQCIRIPSPPGPSPSPGVYCDSDSSATDKCINSIRSWNKTGDLRKCAQGRNKIQNCSIGCGKTCRKESWDECVHCPGQGKSIFCFSDGKKSCPASSSDYSGVY